MLKSKPINCTSVQGSCSRSNKAIPKNILKEVENYGFIKKK